MTNQITGRERSVSCVALSNSGELAKLIGPPATAEWIIIRVTALLSHYWQASGDERMGAIVIKDWVSVLNGLPQDAVEQACVEWLRSGPKTASGASRRPTPSDIYARASRIVLQRHPSISEGQGSQDARAPLSEAERARNRARIAEAFPEILRP